MIASLGQPLLFLFAFGFGLSPIYAKAGGGDYIQFIAPGIIAMTILFNSVFSGLEIIWDKQFGFLKETLVAPVSRFQIVAGKIAGGATVAFVQGLIIFGITFIAGFRIENWSLLPLAIFFMILVALLFSALGTAIAARMNDMQGFPLIMNFLIMPLFFLSGALFPIKDLPQALLFITKINPLSYGIDGIRGALTGSSYFSLGTDFIVLTVVLFVVTAFGVYQFSKVEA